MPARQPMIALLSLDFDGTIVEHDAPIPIAPAFVALLERLRGEGVRWAINTGRALHHIEEGLAEVAMPFRPDFVLTAEREVFRPRPGGGWTDFGDWNRRCARDHDRLFDGTRHLLREIEAFVRRETAGRFIDDATGLGLATADDAEMGRVVEFIDRLRADHPEFHYQRNGVFLRFCHAAYSKGTALGELARLLDLGREQIFAAGDHLNDISMLDGRYARWCACPANAATAVKETVVRYGGYLARQSGSAGVAEALEVILAAAG